MNKKIRIVTYCILSIICLIYLVKANQLYLSLEEYGLARAESELYLDPIIEVVEIKGNDAILFAHEGNYSSCYFARRKFGLFWQSFSGIGMLRETENQSVTSIKKYKQECINMYDINHMEDW